MRKVFAGTIIATIVIVSSIAGAEPTDQPDPAALKRTQRTVLMLDDVYKQAIVLITDKYVNDETDFPAGSAAVQWFDAISKKGWHDVRLIDATGLPVEDKNVAKDSFEKEGVRKLKQGAPYYEQVVKQDGKYRLRALTPVPVVMKKCIMCHEHYADAKDGEPIGAISYSIEIE